MPNKPDKHRFLAGFFRQGCGARENYCLDYRNTKKKLSHSEMVFIQKQLKSKEKYKEVNIKDVEVKYDIKEAHVSMGGPHFTCVGRVAVYGSKSKDAYLFSYDIMYQMFIDEGYGGISSGINRILIPRF